MSTLKNIFRLVEELPRRSTVCPSACSHRDPLRNHRTVIRAQRLTSLPNHSSAKHLNCIGILDPGSHIAFTDYFFAITYLPPIICPPLSTNSSDFVCSSDSGGLCLMDTLFPSSLCVYSLGFTVRTPLCFCSTIYL